MTWLTTTQIYKHSTGQIYVTPITSNSRFQYGRDAIETKPIEAREWKPGLKRHENLQTELKAYRCTIEPAVLSGQIDTRTSSGAPDQTFSVTVPGFGRTDMIELIPSIVHAWWSEEEEQRDRIKRQMFNKLEMETTGLLEGVFLAELHKTVDLLANPFQGLSRLLQRMIRSLTDARNAKDISSAWLRFQFGAKPLLYDIRAISNDFEKFCEDGWFKLVKTSSEPFTSTRSIIHGNGTTNYVISNPNVMRIAMKCKIRMYSTLHMSGASLLSQKQVESYFTARPWAKRDLYIHEIKMSLWEVIKFSWLYDYFRTADHVSRADRIILNQANYTFFRFKREVRGDFEWFCDTAPGIVTDNTLRGNGVFLYSQRHRDIDFSLRPPDSYIQAPKAKQDLNIMALFLSRLF